MENQLSVRGPFSSTHLVLAPGLLQQVTFHACHFTLAKLSVIELPKRTWLGVTWVNAAKSPHTGADPVTRPPAVQEGPWQWNLLSMFWVFANLIVRRNQLC